MVTVVTKTSWGGRIAGSFKGILVGLFLFGVAFPVLWTNEKRSVLNIRTIAEVAKSAVAVPGDTVEAAREGHLIHVSGEAQTPDQLEDPDFALKVNAIHLQRQVEMYQWVENTKSETRKKLGGGEETVTTYTYEKSWRRGRQDSDGFKDRVGHENPEPAYPERSVSAENVRVRAYRLSPGLIGQYHAPRDVAAKTEALPGDLAAKAKPLPNGGLYLGAAPESPQIGDLRIRFQEHPAGPASVIARQQGDALTEYLAKSGKTVEWLYNGQLGIPEMCDRKRSENSFWTWLLRGGGFLLMWIGLGLVLRPLRVLADVVPLIGSVVGAGLGLVSGLVAFLCAATTIAVAWIAVRPLTAVPAVVAVVAVIFVLRRQRAQTAAAATGYPPPPPPPG
jgi:hypothetical protein